MTRSLISISIGPVQEFIAAARRTADLYAGSALLVSVVGAAAGTFDDADRIFPLDPAAGGANKILAIVDGDPAAAAAAAREAALDALRAEWAGAWKRIPSGRRSQFDEKRALAQIEDFLEFYAAWVPLPDGDAYAVARRDVERLLAGRKALRDFGPADGTDAGVFKSTLDPALPSVVRPDRGLAVPAALSAPPLFLKRTEHLDAVSIMKRIGGTELSRQGGARGVLSTRALAQRSIDPAYTDPKPAREEDDPDSDEFVPTFPYLAILVGDGDGMGALLSRPGHDSEVAHRKIAGELGEFTEWAKEAISDANGQLVYLGGDDVLALLPVASAVRAARDLVEAFELALDGKATLSIGLAIVHYLEPLGVSLARARAAERAAKGPRNALHVALHTRGGSPVSITQTWNRLTLPTWQEHSANRDVPRGLAYELGDLARQWPESAPAEVLNGEVKRIIAKKLTATARDDHPTHPLLKDLPTFSSADELTAFANQLVIIRFLTGDVLLDRAPAEVGA